MSERTHPLFYIPEHDVRADIFASRILNGQSVEEFYRLNHISKFDLIKRPVYLGSPGEQGFLGEQKNAFHQMLATYSAMDASDYKIRKQMVDCGPFNFCNDDVQRGLSVFAWNLKKIENCWEKNIFFGRGVPN